MSILNHTDSHAFPAFMNQADYAESGQVTPEWNMYSSPEMMQEDLDLAQIQKREALAKATKDLMALDASRWHSQNGHNVSTYDIHGQQQGYDAYQGSPLEQPHGTPNIDYDYQYRQQQQAQPLYSHSRHDMFPFLNKQHQQMRYAQNDHVLPPISVNLNGSYPPSRASATPPISASSTNSYSITTPTLPTPNNTPFLPMNVASMNAQQPHRGSPVGSQPGSLRASPALPPSLSNLSKRSTYDDLPLLPPSAKRQRLSPVSANDLAYSPQRSLSYPIPGSFAQYPAPSSHYLSNDNNLHMYPGTNPHGSARISSTRLAPSRAASVSSNCSSRPGSSHASLQPHSSSKPALLSPSQKKANHIQSEQKRRANIRRGYEALCQTVPALQEAIREEESSKAGKSSDDLDMEDEKGPRRSSRPKRVRGKGCKEEAANDKVDGRAGPRSENVVLSKTIEYINELLSERAALLDRYHAARSVLPAGHPALTPLCQNTCVLKEKKPKNNDPSYLAKPGDENSAMISLHDELRSKDGVVMIPLWEREWRCGEDDEDDEKDEADCDDEEDSA